MTHPPPTLAEQNRSLAEVIAREETRLRRFIRRHLADEEEAEDILQEVFYELVDAYRLMKPIEQLGAWLFRVARNRIIDRFRRVKPSPLPTPTVDVDGVDLPGWEELLPSDADGPDAAFAREVLLEQIEIAIVELPPQQREIFIAHELEGRSFKDLALEMNTPINTLLARKHAAVMRLRARLLTIYEEYSGSGGTLR